MIAQKKTTSTATSSREVEIAENAVERGDFAERVDIHDYIHEESGDHADDERLSGVPCRRLSDSIHRDRKADDGGKQKNRDVVEPAIPEKKGIRIGSVTSALTTRFIVDSLILICRQTFLIVFDIQLQLYTNAPR